MRSTEERNRLAAENVGLALWVAKRYAALAQDREAIFSEARLGLLEAAEHYDPARGKFSVRVQRTFRSLPAWGGGIR